MLKQVQELINSSSKANKDVAFQILIGMGVSGFDAHLMCYKNPNWNVKEKLYLSGVDTDVTEEELGIEIEVGYGNNKAEDLVTFVINNQVFYAYTDPDDGYRSYACVEYLGKFSDRKQCKYRFEPVEVEIEELDEDGEEKFTGLKINLDGEELMELGTTHGDEYYPYGVCYIDIDLLNKKIKQH